MGFTIPSKESPPVLTVGVCQEKTFKKIEMKYTPNHITEKTPLKTIHEEVCDVFDVELDYPFQKSNKTHILRIRQWFHYFSATLNDRYEVSYAYIGDYYSKKSGWQIDHATVINSCKKIQNYVDMYKSDRIIKQKILEKIEAKLK